MTDTGPLQWAHPIHGALLKRTQPARAAIVTANRYLVRVHRAAVATTLAVAVALGGCASAPKPTPSVAVESGAAEPAPSQSVTAASPTPSPSRTGPLFEPETVTLNVSGYWSWAFLDFKTGQLVGSTPPTATSDTASMSKAWVAADYLRRAGEKGQQPSKTIMSELSTMIRDSDTTHTFEFHVANGNLASIQRMSKMCGLTETRGTQNSWSLTQMSARDVARLAKCIADGRAAGPKWTSWLLNEMRNVRGPGRFGIIEALPADVAKTTAIKNGWLARDDGQWHIACMATGDGWSLAVMARYRSTLGKDYGAKTCREVTKQLLAD